MENGFWKCVGTLFFAVRERRNFELKTAAYPNFSN